MPSEFETISLFDTIISHGLTAALALSNEIRNRIQQATKKHADAGRDRVGLLREARSILAKIDPLMAVSLSDATMMAWLFGQSSIAKRVPALDPLFPPPPGLPFEPTPDEEPIVFYPMRDEAIKDLSDRKVLLASDYYEAEAEARARAFTVSNVQSERALQKIQEALADDVAKGGTLREFERRVDAAIGKGALARHQVENVYRSNVGVAYATGQRRILSHPAVSGQFPYLAWHSTRDSRVRKDHWAMETAGLDKTNVYRADDPSILRVWPPAAWNCFVPETEVQGRFLLGFRSWYDGEIVQITTRSGKNLCVTANHPVLAEHGFVPANLLGKGINVVGHHDRTENRLDANGRHKLVSFCSRASKAGFATISEHKHYAPTSIEKVFRSLADVYFRTRRPTATDDFHGDARFGDGYVDVVDPFGMLGINGIAELSQGIGNFSFAGMNSAKSLVASYSHFDSTTERLLDPFSGSMAGCDLPLSRGFAHRGPLQKFRFGTAANIDTSFYQGFTDRRTSDSDFIGNLFERFSADVLLDEIVDIRKRDFDGHVYDLQSEGGFIVANGIFASNCRCFINPISLEMAAARGVKEAIEWLRTGIPPANPQWVASVPYIVPPNWQAAA